MPFNISSGTGNHVTIMEVALRLYPVTFTGGALGAKNVKITMWKGLNVLKWRDTNFATVAKHVGKLF